MVVGYDSYHDSAHRGKTVGSAVFSMDPHFTQYYCRAKEHGEARELVTNLGDFMRDGLKKFYEVNGGLPDRIFFYRDGVGDGQIPILFHHEIPQLLQAYKNITDDMNYNPKMTFSVVTKRTTVRYFMKISREFCSNPKPGTVVDHTITRPERYDFYLVPQACNQGTVSPVAYNIIYDTSQLRPDHLQRLAYKLSHMYYNWQGTIRVPAPCQYAHKLAFLVAQSVHGTPDESLCDKLFFL